MPSARKRPARGFTLLEVLVVVLIMGILLTTATLSFNTNEMAKIKDEAQRMVSLMTLAREQAILDGLEMAVAFTDTGYHFEVYDGVNWVPVEGDNVLRQRAFPPLLDLEVNLTGEPLKLTATSASSSTGEEGDDKKKDDKEKEPIRVFLLSSGEMTPFEVFLGHEEREGGYLLTGDAVGKLTVKSVDGTS